MPEAGITVIIRNKFTNEVLLSNYIDCADLKSQKETFTVEDLKIKIIFETDEDRVEDSDDDDDDDGAFDFADDDDVENDDDDDDEGYDETGIYEDFKMHGYEPAGN